MEQGLDMGRVAWASLPAQPKFWRHRKDGHEWAVAPLGSQEERDLRGSGSGDTFRPNPDGWRQQAVVGEVVVFVRELT